MNKPSKCKNCQWYGKPYWSIINPCDNCPNENEYKTIIKVNDEPIFKETLTEEELKKAMTEKSIFELIIEEKDKEIDRLNNIISELEKFCKDCIVNHQIARENGDYTISDTFFEMILDKLKELKEKE